MCTVLVQSRPGAPWPLLLAANRDEMLARPWDAPAPHWPTRPDIIAGRDRVGGGTWLGLNQHGVIAAVLNRPGSLGAQAGKRSRGELPLLALEQDSADSAAARIAALDASAWRGFNMVLADRSGAWFLRGAGRGHPKAEKLPPGLAMVTARDPNDQGSPRVARHLPRFRNAELPTPPDWRNWPDLLADRTGPPAAQLNVAPLAGFGTVCASLLALPAAGPPVWLFAPGPPDRAAFNPVPLPWPV